MKKLLLVIGLLYSINVFADSNNLPGLSELTDMEKAEIQLQVQKKIAEKNQLQAQAKQLSDNIPDPDMVQKYVTLGEGIGKAFGGAAKEVGVTVNEFVKTPVGLMAMILIVWNYMGAMIVHLFAGMLLLIVGIMLVRWWFYHTIDSQIEYDPEKTDIFGRNRILNINRSVTDNMTGWTMTMFIMVVVGSIIVMFTGW